MNTKLFYIITCIESKQSDNLKRAKIVKVYHIMNVKYNLSAEKKCKR